ncbi:high mobility group box domain-containing protein [Spinellus fusiger]|nr:high mobility group box domain-containing protein [Spinellus fusiger]
MLLPDSQLEEKYLELKSQVQEALRRQDMLRTHLKGTQHQVRRLRSEKDCLLEIIEKNRGLSNDPQDSSASDPESIHSQVSVSAHEHHEHYSLHANTTPSLEPQNKPSKKRILIKETVAQPPRTKKKKDPNAPKSPGNPFFLYCRMERDRIKERSDREMNLGEISRVLGQEWKALEPKEKQKYLDLFKKEYDTYEEALKTYTASVEAAVSVDNEGYPIISTGLSDTTL